MEPRHRSGLHRGVVPALVSLLAAAAAVAAWIATRHGPLLSPDSVTYFSLSRNLAAGKGYVDLTGQPNTTFAPVFPALLAAGQVVGVSAATAARLVNAASYGGLVVLAWILLRRHTESRGLALAATALVVVSPALLNVSAHAWSEPLFCVVVLGFILVLEEGLSRSRPHRTQLALIAGAGLLAGVGFMIRYAALTLVPVALIVILLSRECVRARIEQAAVFLLASLPVPAIWLLRNASSGARYLLGPRSTVNESIGSLVGKFTEGAVQMFVTDSSAQGTRLLVLLSIAVLAGIGLLAGLRRRYRTPKSNGVPTMAPLVAFVVVYIVAIVASGKAAGSSIDLRIVTPIFVPVVVVAAWLGSQALAAAHDANTWARRLVYVVVIGALVGMVSSADGFVRTAWRTGRSARGYATDSLASSPLARDVKEHAGHSAIVTTNSPWALYSATGHQPIFPKPGLYPSASLAPPTTAMLADAACGHAVFFAWYSSGRHPGTDLGGGLKLTVVDRASDGVLYRVHSPRATCRAKQSG